ncbi:MAG: hypothetical protein Q9168_000870 [Polycauliona sp. 1 TL-2023]
MSKMKWPISALNRTVRVMRNPIHDFRGKRSASVAVGNTASADLKISQDRLMTDIHATCEWGQGPRWGTGKHETGMSRLALSDDDKEARDWFVHTTRSIGCDVTVDSMGNIFAVRPGRNRGFPPTCAGSHLDTQPTGGRYDGILGVCAGLEMLKVLHEHKMETHYPVGVINWTNEEGARFPISMVASGVWAGEIPLEKAHELKEVGTGARTMKQELQRIGHTGTTDFANRSDALLTAAKLILHSHRMAVKYDALASTGIIQVSPGSTNTVPGRCQFSLDIRAAKDGVLLDLEKCLKSDFDEIISGNPINGLNEGLEALGRPCTIEWTLDAPSRATRFDDNCVKCVRKSAEDLLGSQCEKLVQEMISGAGMAVPRSGMRQNRLTPE